MAGSGMADAKKASGLVSVGILVLAMLSVQCSATLAKTLFSVMSPQGVTALRLGFSALILLTFFRPWRKKVPVGGWRPIIAYGIVLGCMNLSFYMAIQRIPLGIAVALEFTGPMVLAALASRSVREFVWVGLALLGVLLLLPVGKFNAAVDPVGIGFALCAGLCWALYIVFGRRAGMIHGATSVAIGTTIAAMLIFPVGLISEGTALFSWSILPSALLVGMFSSALPYWLEMIAMTRLPAQTFGVLMSLEPSLAALSGFIFLHEELSIVQWTALACVMAASAGATLSGVRKR